MEERIPFRTEDEAKHLLGTLDRNLRFLRERYGIEASARAGVLRLQGDEVCVRRARAGVERLLRQIRAGREPDAGAAMHLLGGDDDHAAPREGRGGGEGRESDVPRRTVEPRTEGQRRYVEAIRKNPLTLSVGPAGTGKTFLAVSVAVEMLRDGRFRKLVLARPAVEAGEKLGFLPGDLQAKVNPYLRPLMDALFDLLPPTQIRRYLDSDVIEIVPLAYMRGRTLSNAFIILDEAQNTTLPQMKMFLTRMGDGSRVVVNGDVTQIDLPTGVGSGLVDAVQRLRRIRGIQVVALTRKDIVRHPLVQQIVSAYEKDEAEDAAPSEGRRLSDPSATGEPDAPSPVRPDAAPSAGPP